MEDVGEGELTPWSLTPLYTCLYIIHAMPKSENDLRWPLKALRSDCFPTVRDSVE